MAEPEQQSYEVLDDFAKEFKFDVNPDLASEQRYRLLNVLYHYRSTFARDLRDVKVYKGLELDLELRDPKAKSYTRQYPLSVADTEEIDRQVKQLYDAGLLRENDDCSWNSPVLCVGIKDGSRRMVVDLRRVNKLLKPIITLLPKIDDFTTNYCFKTELHEYF